jgi:hypothetical protein
MQAITSENLPAYATRSVMLEGKARADEEGATLPLPLHPARGFDIILPGVYHDAGEEGSRAILLFIEEERIASENLQRKRAQDLCRDLSKMADEERDRGANRQTATLLRRILDDVGLEQLASSSGELVIREDDGNRRYWGISFPAEDGKYKNRQADVILILTSYFL